MILILVVPATILSPRHDASDAGGVTLPPKPDPGFMRGSNQAMLPGKGFSDHQEATQCQADRGEVAAGRYRIAQRLKGARRLPIGASAMLALRTIGVSLRVLRTHATTHNAVRPGTTKTEEFKPTATRHLLAGTSSCLTRSSNGCIELPFISRFLI